MASTALLGFMKGLSDYGTDAITERRRAEAEIKKAEMLERLRMETRKEEAMFLENLPSAREERARKRSKEERDAESHTLGMETDRVSIDAARRGMALDEQQNSRAERLTNAQIGSYNRSGRGGGGRGSKGSLDSTDTLGDRIGVVNAITERLSDSGLDSNEVIAARTRMLEAAQEGRGLEWFTQFEQDFLNNIRPQLRQRDNDSRMFNILKQTQQ